jgi:hypothetical protein
VAHFRTQVQEEWRRQITKTTIQAFFPSPNLWLSRVSLQDSHLAKGQDLGKVEKEKEATRGRSLPKRFIVADSLPPIDGAAKFSFPMIASCLLPSAY